MLSKEGGCSYPAVVVEQKNSADQELNVVGGILTDRQNDSSSNEKVAMGGQL